MVRLGALLDSFGGGANGGGNGGGKEGLVVVTGRTKDSNASKCIGASPFVLGVGISERNSKSSEDSASDSLVGFVERNRPKNLDTADGGVGGRGKTSDGLSEAVGAEARLMSLVAVEMVAVERDDVEGTKAGVAGVRLLTLLRAVCVDFVVSILGRGDELCAGEAERGGSTGDWAA